MNNKSHSDAGRPCRTRGFTLIELLVVMAIIGILMALLFPAINAAKKQAAKVELLSFIRELSSACRMYNMDHREYP